MSDRTSRRTAPSKAPEVVTPIAQPAPTLETLLTAMHRSMVDVANAKGEAAKAAAEFKPDPVSWPGIDRLIALADEISGRNWSFETLYEWAIPRIRRLGLDPGRISIVAAVEAIKGHPELPGLICHRCWGRQLDEAEEGRWCSKCMKEDREAYEATMSPLIIKSKHEYAQGQLIEEVGAETRHLACVLFGHATFSMATWGRLIDYLDGEHGLTESLLVKTPRKRVIEMLRAGVEHKDNKHGGGDRDDGDRANATGDDRIQIDDASNTITIDGKKWKFPILDEFKFMKLLAERIGEFVRKDEWKGIFPNDIRIDQKIKNNHNEYMKLYIKSKRGHCGGYRMELPD